MWSARFERFAAEKTRRSAESRLFPFVTELVDAGPRMAAIGNTWTSRLFDGMFFESPIDDTRRPACSIVFVRSADGNTGADDPGTLGGGETDKHLIYEGLSRVAAGAVLAGAGTVRGGDIVFSVWHEELVRLRASLGLPRHPVQIVATRRGLPVEDTLLLNVPEIEAVVLTTSTGAAAMRRALPARPWVAAIAIDEAGGLTGAFEQLRARGISRVSCVGGRTLARQLLDAGLVDDVYLTTAPRVGGEPGTPLHPGPWRGRTITRKHGTADDAGVIFEHVLASSRV